MSHDIWRLNTGDVLVEATALVVESLRADTLARVATVTTELVGGYSLHGGGDVGCWFSLRADPLRPTINDHIREGSQSILIT